MFSHLDPTWRMLFNQLLFNTALYEPDESSEAEFQQFQYRWKWLRYLQAKYENDLELAVDLLYVVRVSFFLVLKTKG